MVVFQYNFLYKNWYWAKFDIILSIMFNPTSSLKRNILIRLNPHNDKKTWLIISLDDHKAASSSLSTTVRFLCMADLKLRELRVR